MKPNNPFLISGYVSPEYFCDRQAETATIINALSNERDITLISPRRMGKTGLIKHTFHTIKEQNPEIITIYVDIFATQTLGDFVKLLANAVLGQLDSAPQKAFNRVVQFLKSCRPTMTFDEISGIPEFTIDIAPNSEETTLKEIFEYINSSEKRCYIAIDEFQQITEYPEHGVEALLRSHIQFTPNVGFIFSGSKQHIMQQMFLSAKRPFYQSAQLLSLEKVDRSIYYSFAHNFLPALDEDVFNNLYDNFDGHTWYVQYVLNRLYSYQSTPDDALVKRAISEITNEYAYSYQALLEAYPPLAVRLLRAIASEGCAPQITSGDFIARHKLKAASSVNSAAKKLVDRELIYKTSNGYIIYDRFMNQFLKS